MPTYKQKEDLAYDKAQTRLGIGGCVPNTETYAKPKIIPAYNSLLRCPFCLEEKEFYQFKETKGLYICPICNNKEKLSTLVSKMNVQEFAKWVFEYRLTGFWGKVYPNFSEWNKKLYKLGLSKEFWDNYKLLKGELQISERDMERDENEYGENEVY